MKVVQTILQLAVAAGFWSLDISCCWTAVFHVEGDIKATIFSPSGGVVQTVPSSFKVSVSNSSWQITGYFVNSNYTVSGCDGTNIYTILYEEEQAGQGLRSARPSSITPGLYPTDEPWQTVIPWLVFTSGSYLEQQPERILPGCWGQARNEPDMWIYTNEIQRSLESPYLPINVKYFVDRQRQMTATTNADLLSSIPDKEIHKSIFQYPAGFLCGEYRVKSATNWNGLALPSEFEVTRYYPKWTPKGVYLGPAVIVTFEGEVHMISADVSESFIPETDRLISISDFRFSKREVGVDFITYRSTNGRWPTADEVKADELLRAKVQTASKSIKYFLKRKHEGGVISPFWQNLSLLLFACVLVAPLVFLALSKIKKHRKVS